MEVDNLKYFNELQVIHDNINAFYDKLFDSEEEEYNYNYQTKNQIKILLEKYSEQKKLSKLYIIEALLLLAFNTGCVEDEIISEKILNELYNSKIICAEDIEIFNKFKASNRWY